MSFDVKSLFTSIPLQLALDCTENAIENSTVELPPTYRRHYGPTQPLFDFDVLLVQRQTLQTVTRLCYGLSSFCCCSRNSRAKHREQALATHTRTIPLWLLYVDDTFTAVHKDGINDIHEHLNKQDADMHTVHQGDRRKW